MARAYWWEKKNKNSNLAIFQIGTGKRQQFIFNWEEVKDYWTKHELPKTIPKILLS
jgi:hypothetical protein